MHHLVSLLAAVALLCGGCKSANVNRHMKLLEIENNIDLTVPSSHHPKRNLTLVRKFSQLTLHPAGTPLELTCEAVSGPAPSIHWFKNDAPVYEYDVESNEIIDTNPTSLARIVSTLLVPRVEGNAEYSCLAVSGHKTKRASTLVYSTGDSTELTERSKLVPLAPRILVSYKAFVDLIGSSVALPCRAKGHPRPKVSWRDNRGRVIARDQRMKVLRSGELVITSLRFSDSGEFTCQASNMFGSRNVTTTLYAAKAE